MSWGAAWSAVIRKGVAQVGDGGSHEAADLDSLCSGAYGMCSRDQPIQDRRNGCRERLRETRSRGSSSWQHGSGSALMTESHSGSMVKV